MYLWQDHGIFGVFDPRLGWCRAGGRRRAGRRQGRRVRRDPRRRWTWSRWFGVGFIVVLFTGFYLWYWPGVNRWATALRVQRGRGRFTFNLSLHKMIGLPRLDTADSSSRSPASRSRSRTSTPWYENVTPAAARLRPVGRRPPSVRGRSVVAASIRSARGRRLTGPGQSSAAAPARSWSRARDAGSTRTWSPPGRESSVPDGGVGLGRRSNRPNVAPRPSVAANAVDAHRPCRRHEPASFHVAPSARAAATAVLGRPIGMPRPG